MKNFIEVTEVIHDRFINPETGEESDEELETFKECPLLINTSHILSIYQDDDDWGENRTFIFVSDFENAYCVSELYEEVKLKIKESLE